VKFSKCEFLLESVSFLGHVVTKKIIMVDPAEIVVVRAWAKLTSPIEIQSCVGLAGYYQCFIEGFFIYYSSIDQVDPKDINNNS